MALSRELSGQLDWCKNTLKRDIEAYRSTILKLQDATAERKKKKVFAKLQEQYLHLTSSFDKLNLWIETGGIKTRNKLQNHRALLDCELKRFVRIENDLKTEETLKDSLSDAPNRDPNTTQKDIVRAWLVKLLDELDSKLQKLKLDVQELATTEAPADEKNIAHVKVKIAATIFHKNKLESISTMVHRLTKTEVDQVETVLRHVFIFLDPAFETVFMENPKLYDGLPFPEKEEVNVSGAGSSTMGTPQLHPPLRDQKISPTSQQQGKKSASILTSDTSKNTKILADHLTGETLVGDSSESGTKVIIDQNIELLSKINDMSKKYDLVVDYVIQSNQNYETLSVKMDRLEALIHLKEVGKAVQTTMERSIKAGTLNTHLKLNVAEADIVKKNFEEDFQKIYSEKIQIPRNEEIHDVQNLAFEDRSIVEKYVNVLLQPEERPVF